MSLLAITRPFSPEVTTPYFPDTDFDQDFLDFLQTPPSYDFLELSPSPTKTKGDMSNQDQAQAQIKTEGEREESEDVPMAPSGHEHTAQSTTTPFRMQNLSLDENTHESHGAIDLFGPHAYQGYNNMASSYPTAAPSHNFHHFHPYAMRDYSGAMRNRSPGSPVRPLSPSLSNSPPGSAGSHHPTLSNSPHLVSPMSTIASADTSPGSMGFHYQLPYTATPLSTIGNLANVSPPHSHGHGPGMSMVSGFPYPTLAQNPPSVPGSGGKAGRPRMSRGATSRSNTKRTSISNNNNDDDDSDLDDDPAEGPSQGLGFTPAMQEGEERIPVSNKREDIRKARIESEQGADKSKRRRDELREGFRRLKEVLPQTSQRSSKSSLLDRSVAHIQSIEAANRYLLAQLEAANRELEKLRHTNTELVHAVATNSRGTNSPTNTGGRS